MSFKCNPTYEPSHVLLYAARILSASVIALGAVCFVPMRDGILPVELLCALVPLFLLCNALPFILYRTIPKPLDGKRSFFTWYRLLFLCLSMCRLQYLKSHSNRVFRKA